MSEYELLQAFKKNRSEPAFAQLVQRYAGLVYSAARRRSSNPALAEDITQMVFIRFAQSPPKVSSAAQLAAWLHRTALNVTIDVLRSETRRQKREQRAALMETAPADHSVWEEISPKLDEALNQLNDGEREALLLRFFGQKTMRDVGATMGVSEDAAKMRVSRAVERLRKELGVGAACTCAVLGTLLSEHSAEAAPEPLLTRLAAIRLPAATVTTLGAWLYRLRNVSKAKLFIGGAIAIVVAVGFFHFAPAPHAPVSDIPSNATAKVASHIPNFAKPRSAAIASNHARAFQGERVNILFHVLDSETGQGLPEAKIRVAYFGPGGVGEGHDLLTDANGDAAILRPDDSTKSLNPNVFVKAEGYVPKVVGFRDNPPADYTIKLDPATMAAGLVVDAQGLPVAGVKIIIQGTGNKPGQIENRDFQMCPITNRVDGRWTCNLIPKDFTEIGLMLKKNGYAPTSLNIPVSQVNLTNLILVMESGYIITGRITDTQNQPINQARVRSLAGNYNKQKSTTSDENGMFTLVGVTPENLIGEKWAYEPQLIETNDSGAAVIRETHPFYGFNQYGFATNDAGAVTRVKSRSSWPGIPENPALKIMVQAEGFSPAIINVELLQATNPTKITLSPGKVLRGHIVDEAGHPVINSIVRTDYDFQKQVQDEFGWLTNVNAIGRFEWNSAPAETCYWFEANGHEILRSQLMIADGSDHEIVLKALFNGKK